ncbi:ABC transporter permease [Variibacter gotjawalensis]|uniref:ABC transporter permease n=1 Tax=Variibacter gotjawalensis TaxID=1333996 RepID=UPI001DA4F9AA|nr:iron ABC transporter permease [Variibacter gotjawalensis]NIK48373.1 iron(III) transport system permease protein [Variibacter gotjawalensis]
MPRHPLATLFVVVIAAAALTPIFALFFFAFKSDTENWRHLLAYVLPYAVQQTLLLLAGVAIITTLLGVGSAWLVTAFRFPGRDIFNWLLALPLALPSYIVAYIYVALLDAAGPVQTSIRTWGHFATPRDYWFPEVKSLPGAIVVLSLVLYPYVYLPVRAMFATQSATLLEVARTLGASRWRLVRDVALPLARPALAVGLSLALLETLNDIGASEYLGVQTLTISIYTTWLNRNSLPAAAQIACVMLIVVAILIALERYGRRKRRFAISERQTRIVAPIEIVGGRRWLATLACLLPVVFGFLLPAGFLAYQTVLRGLLSGFDPELFTHFISSVVLAGSATAIALAIGLGLALVARFAPSRTVTTGLTLAGLGYAVPGTVLALGLLSPLVGIDEMINWVSRLFGGKGVGLLVAGSGAAIVIAYVVRFLTIAIGSMQAGLGRISPRVDDAARTLGAGYPEVARVVHLPMLRPALGAAALLIFVDCLKELPATLLLRPLNVETLPTYIYQFATRGDFEEGALAALMIVAAGIYPVIRMTRLADRSFGTQTSN